MSMYQTGASTSESMQSHPEKFRRKTERLLLRLGVRAS
jgi:hypothetical protein